MKPVIKTSLIIILSIVMRHPLYSQSNNGELSKETIIEENESLQEKGIRIIRKEMPQRTIFFNLKQINCPNRISRKLNNRIQKRLEKIPYLRLMSKAEMEPLKETGGKLKCYTRECAFRKGKLLKADKAIIGSVKRVVAWYREKLSTDEGGYKYIYRRKKREYYLIKIELLDIPPGKSEIALEKKSIEKNLDRTVNTILAGLKNYFKPRIVIIKKKIKQKIKKPEKIVKPKKIKEAGKISPWVSMSGLCMAPHGNFSKIIGIAGGINLTIGLDNLFTKNTAFSISYGYYFAAKRKGDIEFFQSMPLSFLGGYSFPVHKKFRITPLIGAGFQFNLIKDFGYNSNKLYIDPLITIQLKFGYNFIKNFYVIFTPGYTIFFSREGRGNYLNIDAGVKYIF